MSTYFEIAEHQLQEIEDFYLSLGYTQSQAKVLSRSAFDSPVSGTAGLQYCKDWNFYSYCRGNLLDSYNSSWIIGSSWMHSGWSNSAGGGSWGSDSMSDSTVTASAAPISAVQPSIFSTAQTHDAPELQEMNPMSDTEVIFSANVNSASWSYVRNSVKRGRNIDASFVRAEEMINGLTLLYNRARQAMITQELTEISSATLNDKD